jgi:hypothetical protein
MHEKLDEPIEVVAHFKADKIMPAAFRWQGRVYHITKLNLVHKERDGRDTIYHFSVSDQANFYRLSFFTRDLGWRISEIYND